MTLHRYVKEDNGNGSRSKHKREEKQKTDNDFILKRLKDNCKLGKLSELVQARRARTRRKKI